MEYEKLGALIPIVSIVFGIGIGMESIYLEYRKKRDMLEFYHKERMAAIEKGIELPPMPDDRCGDDRPRSPHATLMAGLILTLLGLAISVALYYAGGLIPALFALILVGLGLAFLIYYALVGKKIADEMEAEKKAKAAGTSPGLVR